MASIPRSMRVFSSGMGLQSMAALVLSAQGEIDFPIHLFSNVGEDSENPRTLAYYHDVARPFAALHGLTLIELRREWQRGERAGQPVTLYGELTRTDSRTIGIPVRMNDTGAPGNRACTGDFKIKVVSRWLKAQGVTADSPAVVGLGISLDEFERMRTDSGEPLQRLEYPLIDLRLTRDACASIVQRAGLPVPPKSSCFFCPFATPARWTHLYHEQPELFEKAAELEDVLNERRKMLGKDPIWLTRFRKPLRQVIGGQSIMDFDDDACESGYCMT